MNLLSTLTASALHALVARSLEGVTEGPWADDGTGSIWHEWNGVDPDTGYEGEHIMLEKIAPPNRNFVIQSRDLVPELDRRLRETEAKLDSYRALKVQILNEITDAQNPPAEALYNINRKMEAHEAALTRITALTQP